MPPARTDAGDWASGDFAEGEFVKDDDTAIGALADDDRAEPAAEPPPRRARGGRRRAARARRRPPPAESVTRAYEAPVDVGGEPRPSPTVRIATGLGIGALALICWAIGRGGLLVLAMAIVSVAAFELCEAYRRAGYHLATAVALLGSVALVPIAYDKGEQAFPMVAVLVIGFTFLWYLAGVVHVRPAMNVAVSVLAFLYVAFLGSFSALLLQVPFRKDGVTRAELSRRLKWNRESVDRLFRLDHASRLDQLEAAFRALGRSVGVRIKGYTR